MENQNSSSGVMNNIGGSKSNSMPLPMFFILLVVLVLAGTGIGFLPSRLNKSESASTSKDTTAKTAGIVDKKTFKDSAEGTLKEGGIDGEGNFHLTRPGGDSQNVYLTSTTVDLSKYIGKKVRVSGQTFSSEQAGWLMDVGYVEILK